jgi:DNA-directed RNA polymerase specialized sigma24 family protein
MSSKGKAEKGMAPVINIDDPAQLQGLAIQMLAFARRRAKGRKWWLSCSGSLAKGEEVEDVVAKAIASLFGGSRKWNRAEYPDPAEHVRSVINSLLSNLVRAKENRLQSRVVSDDIRAQADDPEQALIRKEEEAALERRRERGHLLLIDGLAQDGQLMKLYDLMVNDHVIKPQELAMRLGVSVKEVNNLKRRFWRACEKMIDALDREPEGSTND